MEKQNRLVVGDLSWADITPQWVLDEVVSERMMLGLITIMKPDIEPVGDAEVLAYLMPVTMRGPITHEYFEIYMYICTKVCDRVGKHVPDDIRQDSLDPDAERELKDLRRTIFTKRGGNIQHPVLNFMRDFKKETQKSANKVAAEKKKFGCGTFFD